MDARVARVDTRQLAVIFISHAGVNFIILCVSILFASNAPALPNLCATLKSGSTFVRKLFQECVC